MLDYDILHDELDDLRKCKCCGEYKYYFQFRKDKNSPEGIEIYCKECQKNRINGYFRTDKGKETMYRNQMVRRSEKLGVVYKEHLRQSILERDNYTCQGCGCKVHDRRTGIWNTPDKAHIDHIHPISKGGASTPDNLQVLCRTCNISKKDKLSHNGK